MTQQPAPSATTPSPLRLVFCGSFRDYSVTVLRGLLAAPHLEIAAVVTTPPRPAGRDQSLRSTAVHEFALTQKLPVFHPETLDASVLADMEEIIGGRPPDFLLTAGYGKLIPSSWLSWPQRRPLNLHFSLLPAFRGANPAEWALLMDAATTGITLMEMDEDFDTGGIIAQEALALRPEDTRETVYDRLYRLGGEMLPTWLHPDQFPLHPTPQSADSPTPYARLLKRDDGFIAWDAIAALMQGRLFPIAAPVLGTGMHAAFEAAGIDTLTPRTIERAARALHGYPGLWTQLPTGPTESDRKRMKIFNANVIDGGAEAPDRLELDTVQIAGQQRAQWNQVKTALYSGA